MRQLITGSVLCGLGVPARRGAMRGGVAFVNLVGRPTSLQVCEQTGKSSLVLFTALSAALMEFISTLHQAGGRGFLRLLRV